MSYTIELNALPRKARNELIEYYEFLLNKYSRSPVLRRKKAEADFDAFLSTPIIMEHFVMPDRESRNER
ncbi:MAG: hypothetical protein WCJ37_20405 [Syntrophus sp. (in: bacteria)]